MKKFEINSLIHYNGVEWSVVKYNSFTKYYSLRRVEESGICNIDVHESQLKEIENVA